MSMYIKDIELMHQLLVDARRIFSDLNGDTITSVSKMNRWCVRCDDLLNN